MRDLLVLAGPLHVAKVAKLLVGEIKRANGLVLLTLAEKGNGMVVATDDGSLALRVNLVIARVRREILRGKLAKLAIGTAKEGPHQGLAAESEGQGPGQRALGQLLLISEALGHLANDAAASTGLKAREILGQADEVAVVSGGRALGRPGRRRVDRIVLNLKVHGARGSNGGEDVEGVVDGGGHVWMFC